MEGGSPWWCVSIVPRVMAGKSRDVWAEEGDDNEKRYQDVWQ